MDMDLSKLLGDVYDNENQAGSEPAAPAQPATPSVPDWSDDERLDKVFADWTPGPPESAPAAERNMVLDLPGPHERLDDDLAAALSAALVDAGGPANEPEIHLPEDDSNPTVPVIDLGPVALDNDPVHVAAAAVGAPLEVESPASFEVDAMPFEVEAAEKTHDGPAADFSAGLMEVPDPVPAASVEARRWQRSDDDILPGRGGVLAAGGRSKRGKAHKAPVTAEGPGRRLFNRKKG